MTSMTVEMCDERIERCRQSREEEGRSRTARITMLLAFAGGLLMTVASASLGFAVATKVELAQVKVRMALLPTEFPPQAYRAETDRRIAELAKAVESLQLAVASLRAVVEQNQALLNRILSQVDGSPPRGGQRR